MWSCGGPEAVEAARAWLAGHGIAGEPLPVDRAFHTELLDPVLDELRVAVEKAELRPVEVEFVSGLDGAVRPRGWLPDTGYLVRQARQPADFHAVLRTLAQRDVLVELGPGAPLTGMVRRALPGTLCVPTQGREPGTDGLWSAVAGLHCSRRRDRLGGAPRRLRGPPDPTAHVPVPAPVVLDRPATASWSATAHRSATASPSGSGPRTRNRRFHGGWHDRTGSPGTGT